MRALEFLGSDGSWYALVPVAEESRVVQRGWTRVESVDAAAVLARASEAEGASPPLAEAWTTAEESLDARPSGVVPGGWAIDELSRDTGSVALWRIQAPQHATEIVQIDGAPLLSELANSAAPAEERTWVAFRLLDLAGDPIPDVPYEIELGDGSLASGTTDGDGNARHDDIVRGACTVTFTDLPDKYWQHEHNAD